MLGQPILATALLPPILAYVALVFVLYAWLTFARATAVRAGRVNYSIFEFNQGEPEDISRITRNLGNQFELPVLFFAAILLLMQFQAQTSFDLAMAWLFLGGRVVHSAVHTLTSNVALRGQIFMINFLGVVGLMAHLAWLALN